MAFDHNTQRLRGIYDFGDAGFGPLHEEFIYTSIVSTDLTSRIITAYEQITRRELDRARIFVLTGVLFLLELAQMGDSAAHADLVLRNAVNWLQAH